MRLLVAALVLAVGSAWAHDAHGRSNAPAEARRVKSPVQRSDEHLAAGKAAYEKLCASCHGEDGRARTKLAGTLPHRPTDLSHYLMESMKDGEIHWVVKHGIDQRMPAFEGKLSETAIWEVVLWVRELRAKQRKAEKARLGPYEWKLPPGFPFPNVPEGNPMTAAKVELGRYLFYDTRLSLNRKQSCASCHGMERAFTDGKGRGVGSTGEVHPRGAMSLMNVAYSPVLTWGNPLMRSLEQQAEVPLFGDQPVELGMAGKEDVLLGRLRAEPRYKPLFAAAFPDEARPFTLGNVAKAIASFERTLLSGDSPYDEYRRGDDANAISDAAKRGEALFFSERLECFHCHGGFNFTGTVDYYGKGFAEVEFHNTGLYNLPGEVSYPEPNVGLYEFTQQPDDVGKFKAPTLRNIAVTAPYMHDGSVKTLEEAVEHYSAGGRTITSGSRAGVGFDNPNKSEFVKRIDLTAREKQDVIAFLKSLTDVQALENPQWANPWRPSARQLSRRKAPPKPKYVLQGEVVRVYAQDGAVSLYHDEIPGFMQAMRRPYAMEFLVADREALARLKPGARITAGVQKRGGDYVLEQIQIQPVGVSKP